MAASSSQRVPRIPFQYIKPAKTSSIARLTASGRFGWRTVPRPREQPAFIAAREIAFLVFGTGRGIHLIGLSVKPQWWARRSSASEPAAARHCPNSGRPERFHTGDGRNESLSRRSPGCRKTRQSSRNIRPSNPQLGDHIRHKSLHNSARFRSRPRRPRSVWKYH